MAAAVLKIAIRLYAVFVLLLLCIILTEAARTPVSFEIGACSDPITCFSPTKPAGKTIPTNYTGNVNKESREVKVAATADSASAMAKSLVDWELRTVPSGPDPLHHHGSLPRKPQTP